MIKYIVLSFLLLSNKTFAVDVDLFQHHLMLNNCTFDIELNRGINEYYVRSSLFCVKGKGDFKETYLYKTNSNSIYDVMEDNLLFIRKEIQIGK